MGMVWGYAPPIILATAIQAKVSTCSTPVPRPSRRWRKPPATPSEDCAGIMNALVGFQFLSKSPDGRYSLTPESATFLVSSKPGISASSPS